MINNKSNSTISKLLLILQHTITMFGATVLIPMLTGLDISVALFSAGIGTLIFHYFTKGEVPVFLGSSGAFVAASVLVARQEGFNYVSGAIIVVGMIYLLIAGLVYLIGVDKIRSLFSAGVLGGVALSIGTNLLPIAADMSSNNYALAASVVAIILLILWKIKKLSPYAILIGVFAGVGIAIFQGYPAPPMPAEVISMPHFISPKFSLTSIAIIAPITLAVLMEHISNLEVVSLITGKDVLTKPGLVRTLVGDGLGTVFAGLVGGPANTTYSENIGLLKVAKQYDPTILRGAAICAVLMSFFAPAKWALDSIPVSVMGGASLVLFSMIAIVGFNYLQVSYKKHNYLDVLLGLIIGVIGTFPVFNIKINSITFQGASLAAMVGIFIILVTKIGKVAIKKFF